MSDGKRATEREMLEKMKKETPIDFLRGIGAARGTTIREMKNPLALAESVGFMEGIAFAIQTLERGVPGMVDMVLQKTPAAVLDAPAPSDGDESTDALIKSSAASLDARFGGPVPGFHNPEASDDEPEPTPPNPKGFKVVKGGNA